MSLRFVQNSHSRYDIVHASVTWNSAGRQASRNVVWPRQWHYCIISDARLRIVARQRGIIPFPIPTLYLSSEFCSSLPPFHTPILRPVWLQKILDVSPYARRCNFPFRTYVQFPCEWYAVPIRSNSPLWSHILSAHPVWTRNNSFRLVLDSGSVWYVPVCDIYQLPMLRTFLCLCWTSHKQNQR